MRYFPVTEECAPIRSFPRGQDYLVLSADVSHIYVTQNSASRKSQNSAEMKIYCESIMWFDFFSWIIPQKRIYPRGEVFYIHLWIFSNGKFLCYHNMRSGRKLLQYAVWALTVCFNAPYTFLNLSLIHIWRCRRSTLCRSRWSPYH